MTCFSFVCVHNSLSCLKLNGDVYAYVDVEVFNRFILKRFLKSCVLTDLPTLICIKHNGDDKPEDCPM